MKETIEVCDKTTRQDFAKSLVQFGDSARSGKKLPIYHSNLTLFLNRQHRGGKVSFGKRDQLVKQVSGKCYEKL